MFHCTTVYNYVRNQDRVIEQNGKTERKRASEQMFMRGHICVCLMCVCVCVCLVFICVWEIGWQHVCHCSRTPPLWSGTADGCLSNASVSMPIQQLKQMLNADISCNCYLPNFDDRAFSQETLISKIQSVTENHRMSGLGCQSCTGPATIIIWWPLHFALVFIFKRR